MNKDVILQNLQAIWSVLSGGNDEEINISILLLLALRRLKEEWLGLEIETTWPAYEEEDPVEIFLSKIAEL